MKTELQLANRDLSDLTEEEKVRLINEMAEQLYLQQKIIESQEELMHKLQKQLKASQKRAKAKNIDIIISNQDVTYDDIGGLDHVLEEIKHFEYSSQYPRMYEVYGIDPPKGLLMYGPPGCGKTMVAKAMSNELDCWFMELPLTQIISKYVGEAEQNLEKQIERARQRYKKTNKKVMLFVDEAEQMFRDKSSYRGDTQVVDRCVNVWLRTMDGMGDNEGLIFVAATNHLDKIDDAILRPGRFDYIVEIPPPDRDGVQDILLKTMRKKEQKAGREIYKIQDVPSIADKLYELGATGADIADILKKTSLERIKFFVETDRSSIIKADTYIYDKDVHSILENYQPESAPAPIGFGT